MTTQTLLGRYRLLGLVSRTGDAGALWHAYDEVLDRPVALRMIPVDHPRAATVLHAAQRAATIEDRRLLRVLDLIEVPMPGDGRGAAGGAPQESRPARAVVSEWASGRHLGELISSRQGAPLGTPEALDLVTDVARAVSAGERMGVGHGRLRPSAVFVTDAGEVRVRGLGVDAALLGTAPLSDGQPAGSVAASDVDGLGGLTYLLTTGTWPGFVSAGGQLIAPAPRSGEVVLLPSQVRASVPRSVDDLVARSLAGAPAPRGQEPITVASGFAAAAGAALDHVAPVTTTTIKAVQVGPVSTPQRVTRVAVRVLAVIAAAVIAGAVGWVGWQLVSQAPAEQVVSEEDRAEILTAPAVPVDELQITGLDQPLPIVAYRSYDPYGDDNGDERPDRRKGLENDELTVTVNDVDPDTAWLTSEYSTADLDGKGGVGLILDLGEEREVQQVTANLIGRGTGLDVRVSDAIQRDPALWTPLGTAFAPRDRVDVRSPRPVLGRYVLLWFTQLPPVEGTSEFQGGVRSVGVTG